MISSRLPESANLTLLELTFWPLDCSEFPISSLRFNFRELSVVKGLKCFHVMGYSSEGHDEILNFVILSCVPLFLLPKVSTKKSGLLNPLNRKVFLDLIVNS